MKRLLLVVGAAMALIAVIGLVYLLQLTAPIEVSNTPPVAATLSVPTRTVIAGETEPAPTENAAQAVVTPTDTREQAMTASPAPASAARVYRIDPDLSQASYRVGETFFDQRGFIIAVGTTNAVAGDILVDPANLPASQVGEIVVDISQLRTDEPMRDNAIRRQWLQSATYPLARFKNAKISGIPATATEGQPFKFQISGDMTVREVTKPVTWEAETMLDGDTLRGTATTKLKMSDFGIEPPSLMILQVEDDVELTLEFVASAVEE